MASVKVNDKDVSYKFQTGITSKLKTAAGYISDELISQAVSNAHSIAGSSALSKFNLYETDYKVYKGLVQLTTISFEYNQDNLVPAVGSDTENYRHTSFVEEGDNPLDYRNLVNSGHVGLDLHTPWYRENYNDGNGYWDKTLEQIPDIVKMGLVRAGIDV